MEGGLTIGIEGDGQRAGPGCLAEDAERRVVGLAAIAARDHIPKGLTNADESLLINLRDTSVGERQIAGAEPRLDSGNGREVVRAGLDVGRVEERPDKPSPPGAGSRRLAAWGDSAAP